MKSNNEKCCSCGKEIPAGDETVIYDKHKDPEAYCRKCYELLLRGKHREKSKKEN